MNTEGSKGVSGRWLLDWGLRLAIIFGTSFAGLAWGSVKAARTTAEANAESLHNIDTRLSVIEEVVESATVDEARVDNLESRLTATEGNRFTSQQGLEVWRELDTKVDRDELAEAVERMDNRFNRLDDKLDRLITLAGE